MRDAWIPLVLAAIAALWFYTRLVEPGPPGRSEEAHEGHEGMVVSLGGGRFHVEAVLESGGALRLFTRGADASDVIDVDEQTLVAYVREADAVEAVPVPLKPRPQPGDAPGRTSQFLGTLPERLRGQPVSVTVPQLTVAGRRFRLAFATGAGHAPPMPEKVADADERVLYLAPGGRYTAADIEANGGQTASERFRGFRARHDFDPQPGDRLCPVTRTKANPECAWTIDGRTYEFCCPPCVDEFVRLAKESPEAIQAPDAYVQP